MIIYEIYYEIIKLSISEKLLVTEVVGFHTLIPQDAILESSEVCMQQSSSLDVLAEQNNHYLAFVCRINVGMTYLYAHHQKTAHEKTKADHQ